MDRIIQLQEVERLRAAGQLTEAYMLCKHAYDKDSENVDVLQAMASLALDLNYFDAAESLSRLALSYDPGRPKLWVLLAQSLSALHRDAEAEKADNLAQLDSEAYAALRINAARQQLKDYHIDKAALLVDLVLDGFPGHEDALALLATIKQHIPH